MCVLFLFMSGTMPDRTPSRMSEYVPGRPSLVAATGDCSLYWKKVVLIFGFHSRVEFCVAYFWLRFHDTWSLHHRRNRDLLKALKLMMALGMQWR